MAEGRGLLARPDDRFANVAAATVTESAANTLTYAEIDYGIGLGAGVGLLIDAIEYHMTTPTGIMAGNNDGVLFGLFANNNLAAIDGNYHRREIIHSATHWYRELSSVGAFFMRWPYEYKFTPALIVGTNRGKLYFGLEGASQASPLTAHIRVYSRYIPLDAAEYLELAEAFNLMG